MRNLRFLWEYSGEWQRLGDLPFRRLYGKPILLGRGVRGQQLEQRQAEGRRPTLLSMPMHSGIIQTASLANRVWLIRKSDSGRPGPIITVGRGGDNDLVIPEYTISSCHGQIHFEGEQLFLTDLNSLNGTFINKARLEAHKPFPLNDGDQLVLGRFQFAFLSQASFVHAVATGEGV